MKIIIVGCGKVGMNITEQLSAEEHDVVVIDENSEKVKAASNSFDVMGVVGNGASYNVQSEAGVESADILIAVTASDELNLLCCLIAKKAGNCRTIARVRNPVYSKEVNFIKEELGLSMIINPEYAAATEIARILRFPSAIKIDTFARGRVELLKFKVSGSLKICGCMLMDIKNRFKTDVLVCAVERDKEVIIPGGNFVIRENDIVSIITSHKGAAEFFRRIGLETHQVHKAMLVGGGKIAFYLAKQLTEMGIDVRIIELNRKRCEELCEELPKAVVINGDATNQELLVEEGLLSTEAFVTLTNYDEENILLALYAKSKTDAKLIAKVNRLTFDEVINNMDLGSIVYPKFITSNSILQYVRAMSNSIGSNVTTLYKILDNKAEALEFTVTESAPVIGVPLQKLNLKDHLLVCCINRNGKIITPNGQDMIKAGDTVIIVTTNRGLKDIKDILK
ncbi:MAG: Trk system potassium transporter TrkA [Clostridiales bacterium]|nr:Trk system potassium transporter TrkA [Clostridiales bacterium]MDY3746774.1 Trk system potassium transporter TrkA [Lachnospiraceae bacterium]